MSADRQSADCSIPVADVAREFLHTTGTLSYPTTQLSGRTGSTQSHFPQVRFWTTSSTVYNGWERYRPLSFTNWNGKPATGLGSNCPRCRFFVQVKQTRS